MLTGNDILQLIPQRDPIVMIDTFFGIEDNTSTSALTVRQDNIFTENGLLQECGIIEHIAQSAAARIGYIYTQEEKDIPLGFIGSVDKFELNRLPAVGETLHTTITVLQEIFSITLIQAKVSVDGKTIAACNMKIFVETKYEKKA